MKKKQRVQISLVVISAVIWLASFVWTNRQVTRDSAGDLRKLREALSAEVDRTELFDKGYVTLLVGWALLHNVGKTALGDLIDTVVDDKLPHLALFYAEDQKTLYTRLPEEVARLEVTQNAENFKIWKLLEPPNCQDILPLYLNAKTGAFICGDASTATVELWKRGLPHLSFSPFSGPALAMDPGTWTSKQWIKYIFQGVTR